ncbi:thiolase family protein [Sphingobium amiense]|uniref:Thiolase family protein n=1 Tax=Sphingobium amiense TaxID=135719 RepID=A0A494W8K6_9SPHN|nr:thiolase family protein [Sphingobium amiense]BBD99656.1 thiolase family protein [Sphingobium amiense]
MEQVYVVGVGMTPFGRLPDLSVKQLAAQATQAALRDAGIPSSALEAAFFGNATQGHMEGQHMVRGEIALRAMGIQGIPVVNVENACATASTAFILAVNHLKAGEGDVALALGAEKMVSSDKSLMFSAFDSAWDVHDVEGNTRRLKDLGNGVIPPPGSTSDKPYSVFMDVYAGLARQHMSRFGTTQRQIAAVSSKNHNHSQHNPLSQFQRPFTIEEVLAAPPITYPFTLPMCSPISDGAAAAVIMTEAGMSRHGIDRRRAIAVLSAVMQTGSDRPADAIEQHCTVIAARKAYERAGVGPEDVSVAEVHDATAVGEIIQIENLGLCSFGEGGLLAERGETALGGRVPVNPSGGLQSKGHPIGATGLGQIYELVTQLRGEAGPRQVDDAKIAIAENGGGSFVVEEAVATIVMLGR